MNKIRSAKKLPVAIKIVGLILSESYQKCKLFAQRLRKSYSEKFKEPVVKGYLEMDWVEYLHKLRRDIGGQSWAVEKHVVVFIDDVFIGGEDELFNRFCLYQYKLPSAERIKEFAKQEYLEYLNRENLLYTFFELSLDGKYIGSLLFQLRPDLLPKTSSWFTSLCVPDNHMGYSYKGCSIHRVCRRGWFQGGKLGLAFSVGFLEDESLCYKHDRRGVLSLAKYGKDANRCQFFVTFEPSQWMDEYYVAFGRVVEGSDVLRRLENTKCSYEHPIRDIKVDNCGLARVGLGRQMMMRHKLKGLTVGVPHLHPETFIDLVLERFSEILFERLDEDMKRQFHSEWIGQMIWDNVLPTLTARDPVMDNLDINDRNSSRMSMSRFFKGLYDLKDIPDHYIMNLMDQVIREAVDMSDTRGKAESIANCIREDIERKSSGTFAAESFVKRLSKNVDDIIWKSQPQSHEVTFPEKIIPLKKVLFQKSILKIASHEKVLTKTLSQSRFNAEEMDSVLEEGFSSKESMMRHILSLLIDMFVKSGSEN